MKFYHQDIVRKVRNLRQKGVSVRAIADKTKISKSTIRYWCRDLSSDNSYHLRHVRIRENFIKEGKTVVSTLNISSKTAKILASFLYWCEGYRFSSCNYIGFSNSDVDLVKTFLELFRIGFHLDERKFRAHLQLHTTHDIKKMTSFWSRTLKIPASQFYKPTITLPTKRMKRMDYRGTCTIKYFDFSLFHKITGIYEGLSQKILKN